MASALKKISRKAIENNLQFDSQSNKQTDSQTVRQRESQIDS